MKREPSDASAAQLVTHRATPVPRVAAPQVRAPDLGRSVGGVPTDRVPTELVAVTWFPICNNCNDCPYVGPKSSPEPHFASTAESAESDLLWHAALIGGESAPQAIFEPQMADFIGFPLKIGACGALKLPFGCLNRPEGCCRGCIL